MRLLPLLAVAAGLGLLLWPRRASASFTRILGMSYPQPPPAYAGLIRNAERRHGIPAGLLARQLWQESRYNPRAYNARTGAQGIAQAIPGTARTPGYGVAPLLHPYNAPEAIAWAAAYMAALYRRFGAWKLALAAYNWGPGNIAAHSPASWPAETANYVADITSDVQVA